MPLLWLAVALVLWAPLAQSQNTLGELLDAGARKLTPEEFKQELVQRMIEGPTPAGGEVEVMYASTGAIQGLGKALATWPTRNAPVSGEWKSDAGGRICTAMRIGGGTGLGSTGLELPTRCQYWYKLDQRYFFSDSDTDRSMRVFRRTLKP